MMLDSTLLEAPLLDHSGMDLESADRVTYVLEQNFRYDYDAPVRDLRQRLVVVPHERYGNQHRRGHRVDAAGAVARRRVRRDAHGNVVVHLRADRVERSVEFRVAALIERVRADGPLRLDAAALHDPRWLRATRLTTADPALRELADRLSGHGDTPAEQAERVCAAVHEAMTYEYGVTSVSTTAAEAFAASRGVCQDSAHVMLALCHELGLPARYVSGHLLGQGGTHAWVEVVLADDQGALARPYDPCNGRPAHSGYVTIAVGRDYADVAPTSGSYVGPASGRLTTSRRVGVLSAA